MKLVSTTLSGNSRKHIRDALLSVRNWVDKCIVIDTGITDGTLAVAREAAGNKLEVYSFPWRDDFGAARNFALHAAEAEGADWAITVDTDERLVIPEGLNMGELLADPALVIFANHVNDGYMKERLIRLGRDVFWEGYTHEAIMEVPPEARALTKNIKFDELLKTDEQIRAKIKRDIPLLRKSIAEYPMVPRWYHYLGLALQVEEKHAEAIDNFKRCIELSHLRSGEFWGDSAVYRLAQSYCKLGRFDEALDYIERWLVLRPEAESNLQFFRDSLRARKRRALA